MKNISLFRIQQEYPGGGTAHLATLSLEESFGKLLLDFIENKDNSFVLLETIVLSCILVEAIIRERLRKINPALLLEKIDPVAIALLSNKRGRLIEPVTLETSDVRTANVSTLFERFLMFHRKSKYRKGVNFLFSLRNKILHAAADSTIDKHKMTLVLTRSIFPFIKGYVKVPKHEWDQVEKIRKVAHSAFKADLVRKLIVYKKIADRITKEEKNNMFKEKPDLLDGETILAEALLCPACKYQSVTLVSGIDFDWNPDGMLAGAYYVARCRVCELEFDRDVFEEIAGNPGEYFESDEQDCAWTNIIAEENFDITNYISYDDL